MKNKILILAILFAGLLNSCSSDVYEAPNSFSDVGVYTSLGQQATLRANIGRFITFSDLSQNAISHKWTIGDGNLFLEGSIKTTDTIFDKYIVSGIDSVSTSKTVSVLFKKEGLQKVHLYNTFKDSVAFRGYSNGKNYIKPARKVGNEWVFDTIFMVDVYAKIIPKVEIRQNGTLLDHTKKDTIYVEAGDILNFKDVTTVGRPNARYFSIVRSLKPGVPESSDDLVASSTDADATITFKKLGIFNAFLTSSRSGQFIPGASAKYAITSPIKVIPSSKPFVQIGALKEQEDETIHIPFNSEFNPFLGQESFFKVKVNGVNFPVESVVTNALDATILDIKLVDKIYRSDVIMVAYDGNGALKSTDNRSALAFPDLPVEMFQHEFIKFDFENLGANIVPKSTENLATTTISISTEQAISGTNSLKMEATASGNWSAWIDYIDTFHLDAGVPIMFEYKVYKVSGATINFLAPWINRGGDTNVQQFWHNNIASAPFDTWTTIRTSTFTPSPTADNYNIYWRHNGKGTIYLDDIRIIKVDERP